MDSHAWWSALCKTYLPTDGRREFEKLKRGLLPGDTVVVTKLDRNEPGHFVGPDPAVQSKPVEPGHLPPIELDEESCLL